MSIIHKLSKFPIPYIGAVIWIIFSAGMFSVPILADTITVGPLGEYADIPEAYEASEAGDTILVAPGEDYTGVTISHRIRIIGSGDSTIVRNSVPSSPYAAFRLRAEAHGSEIRNLAIHDIRYSVRGSDVDDVTVTDLLIVDPGYFGIAIYSGNGWYIGHNVIYSGVPTVFGIAVQGWFGDFETLDNRVEFNTVTFTGTDIDGDRHVGIFLAGFGTVTEGNIVLNNRVDVDILPPEGQETGWDYSVGFWLYDYDAFYDEDPIVVRRNRIVGNHFEAANRVVIRPDELSSVRYHNVISENLGKLRSNKVRSKK